MKTHKNLDRLFQEKMKDFEVSPPKNAWDNIEKGIYNSDRKPLIPLWFKTACAAAILLLLTITGVNYFNTPAAINEIDTIVTDQEKTTIPTIINPSEESPENNNQVSPLDETLIVNTKIQEKGKIKNVIPLILKGQNTNKSNEEKGINDNNQISSTTFESKINNKVVLVDLQKNRVVKNTPLSSKKTDNGSELKSKIESLITIVKEGINTEGETLEELIEKEIVEKQSTEIAEILENKNDIDSSLEDTEDVLKNEEEQDATKKWTIATIAGSVSLSSFTSESSLIDQSLISNDNQIDNSLSYGIKIGYQLNKKLSLQSGVNIINVTSHTNNVFVNSSLSPNLLSAINYEPIANSMSINSTQNSSFPSLLKEIERSNSTGGSLSQEFGYIEVPLELKYNLTNGKVGLNLVGGFSTLFLNKNTISYETGNMSAKIGEANNLNDVNFSGNLGFDVDYEINKQLFFNLSPMVKIQTNTFSSNSGNFKPYVIGVYTGLNYRF
jgi:hypothetical protein